MNLKRTDKGGRPKILTDRDENFCVKQMTVGKCATVVKLSKEIKNRFDIDVHPDTISRALKRKGLKSGEKKKNQLSQKKTSSLKKKHQRKT
jgi:transposase